MVKTEIASEVGLVAIMFSYFEHIYGNQLAANGDQGLSFYYNATKENWFVNDVAVDATEQSHITPINPHIEYMLKRYVHEFAFDNPTYIRYMHRTNRFNPSTIKQNTLSWVVSDYKTSANKLNHHEVNATPTTIEIIRRFKVQYGVNRILPYSTVKVDYDSSDLSVPFDYYIIHEISHNLDAKVAQNLSDKINDFAHDNGMDMNNLDDDDIITLNLFISGFLN